MSGPDQFLEQRSPLTVQCCFSRPSGAHPEPLTLSLLESGGSGHKSPELLGICLGAPVDPELGWGRKPWVEESPN
ncbi:hypothetical protein NDU88_005169 [Pleurodeles waltl]|uniref:Uncharacterized protein n=1 Tax=Pleurodeles waltl TaxID=8319 RepID=A0AAV7RJE0_PLEWA|nr:hypothetical protein NDU88_005169 [Pleurodeles waltl]